MYSGGTLLAACNGGSYSTYYHDGSGTNPVQGDRIYTTSTGTGYASSGYYSLRFGTGVNDALTVSSYGYVSSLF